MTFGTYNFGSLKKKILCNWYCNCPNTNKCTNKVSASFLTASPQWPFSSTSFPVKATFHTSQLFRSNVCFIANVL